MVKQNGGQATRTKGTRSNDDDNRRSRNSKVDDSDDDDDPDDDDDDDDDDDGETFTQAEVNEILRKRLGKAKRQTTRELLSEIGVDSVEDLKAKLEANKGTKTAPAPAKNKKSEGDEEPEDKVDVEALRKEIEADLRKKEAARDLADKIKDKLMDDYGMTAKQANKARSMVTVKPGADDDEVQDAIEELEEDFPELFSRGEEEGDEPDDQGDSGRQRNRRGDRNRRDRPSSNPGRGPRRRRGKAPDPAVSARTLLYERHPELKKNSTNKE